MSHWREIYDLSVRVFRRLLCEEQDTVVGGEECGAAERIYERLSSVTELSQIIRRQQKYDYKSAYWNWRRYRRNRFMRRWSVAVAGGVLLLGCGLLWRFSSQEEKVPGRLPVVEIRPGIKKAVLTLADGTVWNLRDSSVALGGEAKGGAEEATDWQAALAAQGGASPETVYSTLSIPRGGEFCLTLPDSTVVWLNSETVLRFPVRFGSEGREVYLRGEAYFAVAHDPARPFRVRMDEGNIRVLGTEFGVSAYAGEKLAATLVAGSIDFEASTGRSCRLLPSQRLTYCAADDRMSVEEVDTWAYTSWRKQIFSFDECELEEIMTILGRWYDVSTVFETEELRHVRLSGTLDKYSDIRAFFRLFEETLQTVRFRIQGKNIVVTEKKR